jgi:rifampicin phosphotransferase
MRTCQPRYVLGLEEVGRSDVAIVGGKGAHLGELLRIDGVGVPAGFCVTTDAFRQIMARLPSIDDQLDRLSRLAPDDRDAIRVLSGHIRQNLEAAAIPDDVAKAINGALAPPGERRACAIRSSATAEDLPTASFAGQQDTYLNVVGPAAIMQHVSRCWASLFSERAVTYRLRNSFDHRKVQMAVVVQQMVLPQAAGICFTADPVTSNRMVTSVEATFGLGEAIVAGLVHPDVYKVRDGHIVAKAVATKKLAVQARPEGGTEERDIPLERQDRPALTDAQVVRLEQLGRRIEEHFGHPQDIEWCLVDDVFQIVQSRPITALFPVPRASDRENRVYVSVGHQQMMTDPMKPLGLSLWQLTALRPMYQAGGRLFVDVTDLLRSPTSRRGIVEALGRSDPLIGDALQTILDRNFVETEPDDGPREMPAEGIAAALLETDPAIVSDLIEGSQASLATLKRDIQTKSGSELLDFIRADVEKLKGVLLHPQSGRVIRTGMDATWWLNQQLEAWLGEKNAADVLTQSVPNNVTSEMGLALLDLADIIRPHAEVVAFLDQAQDDGFVDDLPTVAGGQEARAAWQDFLDKYGMRCIGEIDITRPRWSERPTTLLPIILGHIRNFETGESGRRFERGRREAGEKEQELLARLRTSPDGEEKAQQVKAMINRLRIFIGYREYPKYHIVSRYWVYKQALLKLAEHLEHNGVLREKEDIFYLAYEELDELVCTNQVDNQLLLRRRQAFSTNEMLTPPRVLTSEGEVVTGTYRRNDVPVDALVGLSVSAGTIEGRARVIVGMAEADLEAGDILVTAYTDPSWTPAFVTVKGLVTEVGGLMTHGAVIAREYGLPAVVGVEGATQLIRDGQRIRVNGTEGYVEILS